MKQWKGRKKKKNKKEEVRRKKNADGKRRMKKQVAIPLAGDPAAGGKLGLGSPLVGDPAAGHESDSHLLAISSSFSFSNFFFFWIKI